MTGAEFAAAGHALALAYARLRPGGPTWLAAWLADDTAAADELHEWELEGHPWSDLPLTWRNTMPETMTVAEAINALLALYITPGTWTREGLARDAMGRGVTPASPEAVAWSLEGALYRVISDPDEEGITEAEWRRRQALIPAVFEACGANLAELNDTVRRQDVVVAVLRAGLA